MAIITISRGIFSGGRGNVIIFAAFIMVIASSIGVPFGVLVTRYVRGVSVRIILGLSILLFAVGTILKLSSLLLEKAASGLEIGSLAVTFGGMGLTVILILVLFIVAVRYRRGRHIPSYLESLVAKEG